MKLRRMYILPISPAEVRLIDTTHTSPLDTLTEQVITQHEGNAKYEVLGAKTPASVLCFVEVFAFIETMHGVRRSNMKRTGNLCDSASKN